MKEEFHQQLAAPPAESGGQYLNASMESLQKNSQGQQEPVTMVLSEHWSRYFATELIGTFIATLMSDGIFFNLSQENYIDVVESGLLFLAGMELHYKYICS